MIEGLKLTMTGEELRSRLDERVKHHEDVAEHYKREATREADPNVEYDCVLPEHMCEYEQEFHEWRAETLAYIREHIEGGEVYRLGPDDLEFDESCRRNRQWSNRKNSSARTSSGSAWSGTQKILTAPAGAHTRSPRRWRCDRGSRSPLLEANEENPRRRQAWPREAGRVQSVIPRD